MMFYGKIKNRPSAQVRTILVGYGLLIANLLYFVNVIN